MVDDLLASLNRQIREEVLENYLTERHLVTLQIEEVNRQAAGVRDHAQKTGRRLNRLFYLSLHSEEQAELLAYLKVEPASFWDDCCRRSFSRRVRLIRVRALTDRAKFRKLFLEAYKRLYCWMAQYRDTFISLEAECRAVNTNISAFHRNFDLLTILHFLKNLDSGTETMKQFLGENFTAKELASVDKKLYIKPLNFSELKIPYPLPLPDPPMAEPHLTKLANTIFSKYHDQVRLLMR